MTNWLPMVGPRHRARFLALALSRSLRPYTDVSEARGRDLRRLRALVDSRGVITAWRYPPTSVIRRGPVRARWIKAAGTSADRGVILYVHGGGFVFGSVRSHLGLVRRLSAESGLAVFFPEYRLAPEHPFPAAPDDVLAAYRYLLDEGTEPRQIVLAGDSVGGALIATLLGDLRRLGFDMPAGALLMSPALDVTASRALVLDGARRDPMLSPQYGLRCAESYLAGASPQNDRVAVLDQDLSGWPPVLIQVGDTECMLGDAEALAAALTHHEVPHRLEVWPGQVHVFQAFSRLLPEARKAIRIGGAFLRDCAVRDDRDAPEDLQIS